MEFEFDVNQLLPSKINKITGDIVPRGFRGDRRELSECQRRLTRILDDMGEASARAQGLNTPITSARKLRDTDHIVYLLVDSRANDGLGSVIGLLKTGSKNLFMFDEAGLHHELRPRCILDFYVHESRQRMGLGNILYQHMLNEEKVSPVKLAIDRPSEKFLAFLRKYYGLSKIIPQNNKFVVFHGFFGDESQGNVASHTHVTPMGDLLNDSSSSRDEMDPCARGETRSGTSRHRHSMYEESTGTANSYGRYAAARPPCSMADIIHNTAVLGQPVGLSGNRVNRNGDDGVARRPRLERPRSLSLYSEEEQKQRTSELSVVPTPAIPEDQGPPFVPVALNTDARTDEETSVPLGSCARQIGTSATSVKNSPSCARQVSSGDQASHLDLKFYHSPLW